MNNPRGVLVWMGGFLAVVVVVAAVLFRPLQEAFLANPVFNGMIIGVLLVGIGINTRQVLTLAPDWNWLRAYRTGVLGTSGTEPRLLLPVAKILTRKEGGHVRLSAMAMRSLLDGIRLRLDEGREISHYMTGLLIFLGLLGTFWGLLQTVGSVSDVIAGLSGGGDEMAQVFNRVKSELQAPLAGMGTAFSSSLFGLAGALVLGFLDLQAGHAQNRFFNHLEEDLAESAHVPSGALGEGEGSLPTYVQALLEQTADSLDKLQRAVSHAEEERRATDSRLGQLAERLGDLSDHMRGEQKAVLGLTKSQGELQPTIERLSDTLEGRQEAMEAHLRNMESTLGRILEETASGRKETVETLRSELRLLARASAGGRTPEA